MKYHVKFYRLLQIKKKKKKCKWIEKYVINCLDYMNLKRLTERISKEDVYV